MKYKFLDLKSENIITYITDNNLTNKLIDSSRPSKYSISDYHNIYQLFQKSGCSYDTFYEIINYSINNPNKIPKRTALHTYKSKLSKLNINKNMYDKWISDNKDNFIKGDLSIDSMTIFNKSNSILASSHTYKGKKAIKISHIINQNNIPLYCSIDPATVHDSKIAEKIIATNIDSLSNHNITLLGDKGYDSNNLRKLLTDNNCHSIIPINKRRSDAPEIKAIKLKLKTKSELKQKRLMKKQKIYRIKINEQKRELQKIKNMNETDKLSIDEIGNIIKEYVLKINKIKNERQQIQTKLKEQIRNEITKYMNDNNTCECNKYIINRICPSCNKKEICINCNICNNCKKNLTYYKGLENDDIKRYKKRINIEHVNSHLKYGRIILIRDRKIKMLNDTVYNRFIDLMMIWKQKQIYDKDKCIRTL